MGALVSHAQLGVISVTINLLITNLSTYCGDYHSYNHHCNHFTKLARFWLWLPQYVILKDHFHNHLLITN